VRLRSGEKITLLAMNEQKYVLVDLSFPSAHFQAKKGKGKSKKPASDEDSMGEFLVVIG
jgi:hypothetical protein